MKNLLSILLGGEGCSEEYSSACEFKHHLKEVGLIEEKMRDGWVFGRDGQQLDLYANNTHKIIALLKHISSTSYALGANCLIQSWAAVEIEGGHRYLSTSNQPFYVSKLSKGTCWYRNICMGRVFGMGADAEQLGSVGRAYRNKQPESTPDLRLYSNTEFPLRDDAASSGFKGYMALPLFDFHHQNPNQCFGVLEILSDLMDRVTDIASAFDEGLKKTGLRSTHIPFYRDLTYKQQVESEITEILELSIKAIPRLSLVQVWMSCKQCHNSRCLEIASSLHSQHRIFTEYDETDYTISEYVEACKFHNLQMDVSRLGQDLYDVNISKNPLAHYAEKAGLSHVVAICLQSVNNNSNEFYVMEFFLQPKHRDGDFSSHLLFKILETKLKSFKCVLGGKFLEDFIVQSRMPPNAFELESIDMLTTMNSCMKEASESNLTKFLETDEICCLRPSSKDSDKDRIRGWVFCSPIEEKAYENDVNNHSLRVPQILIKEKMHDFMMDVASNFGQTYCMVQFWAHEMVENRHCLSTSAQPYVVSCRTIGTTSFRTKCIEHHYFVDEEAKDDELGPVGRVFRNGYPELLYDIFSYSTREFSMRNYAIDCGFKSYFAVPVFDEHQEFNIHYCVGVLEFIGFKLSDWNEHYKDRQYIRRTLEGAKLCWDIQSHLKLNVYNQDAKNEINNAFYLISRIPQCYEANCWVSNGKCTSTNSKCMERLYGQKYCTDRSNFTHIEPRIGLMSVVLESDSKSCFCRNVCELGQSLSHYVRKLRCSACFVVRLQSSHSGDLLYVLEFFLCRVPATLEYLLSLLNFLLPVLKHELKSFNIAYGKPLGEEELEVEFIEFSETNQLNPFYSYQLGGFTVKFKSVVYSQKKHQRIEEQQVQSNPEAELRKQCNCVASSFKETGKGKRKMGPNLSLEVLKPHFGKKLEDVAEELGVGRSTIKRACRDYGINRWPGNEKQARNPSLIERIQHHMRPSSSSNQDTSLQQHSNTERTQDETEKVMIKVNYEGDVIKFELCLPLGVVKLREEVGRRLKLKVGGFKLKYIDESNEEILITCDEDLQFCLETRELTGETCIRLLLVIPK